MGTYLVNTTPANHLPVAQTEERKPQVQIVRTAGRTVRISGINEYGAIFSLPRGWIDQRSLAAFTITVALSTQFLHASANATSVNASGVMGDLPPDSYRSEDFLWNVFYGAIFLLVVGVACESLHRLWRKERQQAQHENRVDNTVLDLEGRMRLLDLNHSGRDISVARDDQVETVSAVVQKPWIDDAAFGGAKRYPLLKTSVSEPALGSDVRMETEHL